MPSNDAFSIAPVGSRRKTALVILIFQRLRNRPAPAFCRHYEFYEAERFRRAGISMGMDRAGRDEQAVSGVQRDGRLPVLLPNAGPG